MKKKISGHYCKICGEFKANEKFTGKGHAQHICKACAKLPAALREERVLLSRIYSLPYRLSKPQKQWLEALKADERERVRKAAEAVWEMRFAPRVEPDPDPIRHLALEEELAEEEQAEEEFESEEAWFDGLTSDPGFLNDLEIEDLPF